MIGLTRAGVSYTGGMKSCLPDLPSLGMAAPRGPAEGTGLGGHALDLVWVSDPRAASPRHCLAVNSSGFPRSLSQPLDPTCLGPHLLFHLISCHFPLLPPCQLHRPPCSLHMPSPFPSHSLSLSVSSSGMFLLPCICIACSFTQISVQMPPLPTRPYYLFTNSTSRFPLSPLPCSVFLYNLSLLA